MGVVVLAQACLPPALDVTGLSCVASSDCGEGFTCFRGRCAREGTVSEVSFSGPSLASATVRVSGVSSIDLRRAPVSFGVAGASDAGQLSTPRAQAGCVALGAQLLVLGGRGRDGGLVASELLSPDGLGFVSRPGPELPSARVGHATVVTGNAVYVLGGQGSAPLAEVLMAPRFSDGGVGAFGATTPLPAPRTELSAFARGDGLYAVAGSTPAGLSDEVLRAPMLGDGGLGTWRSVGRLSSCDGGCNAARAGHGSALWNGVLHVAGGRCAGPCATVAATFGDDGALAVVREGPPLPAERSGLSLHAWRGQLVAVGGRSGTGGAVATVAVAPLGQGVVPLAWRTMPSLPEPSAEPAVCALDEVLVVAGGDRDAGVQAGLRTIASSYGDLMRWRTLPALAVEREQTSAAVWNGEVYMVGGNDRTRNPPIERATVLADGTLGPWVTAGHLLRDGECAQGIAANGYLYGLGSCEAQSGFPFGRVQWAPFLPNGDVGPMQEGPELMIPTDNVGWRSLGVGIHHQGFLYVLGYTRSGQVLMSALDRATGRPGAWQPTTPLPVVQGHGAGVVATRGRLYVVAGSEEQFGGYQASVLVGTLTSDGRVASWAHTTPLPKAFRAPAIALWNGAIHVTGGCNGGTNYCGTPQEESWVAPILPDAGVGAWAKRADVPDARRDSASASVQGSFFSIGGKNGNPTGTVNVTSLDPAGTTGEWSSGPAFGAPLAIAQAASWRGVGYVAAEGAVWSLDAAGWQRLVSVPSATQGASVVAVDGVLVVAGGKEPTARVVLARPEGGPVLDGPALPAASARTSLTAVGRRVFALLDSGEAVLTAVLDETGTLGAWSEIARLPEARRGASLAFGAGTLFVVGGARSEVLGAALEAQGTLEAWRVVGWVPSPRTESLVLVRDGFLHVVGGLAGSQPLGDVWAAPMEPDGQLHPFQASVRVPLAKARGGVAIVDGALTVIGGTATTPSNEVWRATLWSPRLVGEVSVPVDLEGEVGAIKDLVLRGGGRLGAALGLAARALDGAGASAGSKREGPRAAPRTVPLGFLRARSVELRLELDDGLGARDDRAGATLEGVDLGFER